MSVVPEYQLQKSTGVSVCIASQQVILISRPLMGAYVFICRFK